MTTTARVLDRRPSAPSCGADSRERIVDLRGWSPSRGGHAVRDGSSIRVGYDEDVEPDAELRCQGVGVGKDLCAELTLQRRMNVIEAAELHLGQPEERTVDAARAAHARVRRQRFEPREVRAQ